MARLLLLCFDTAEAALVVFRTLWRSRSAVVAWHDAYGAALASGRWDALRAFDALGDHAVASLCARLAARLAERGGAGPG